jgi:type IV pilus assembly protein PilB
VEYALPGINQVHVNARTGLTFASALRSMLRQDPNVIMVGEIRDQETAEIALKAAQTGQLVLSTLHTNDSVSAIVRLLDLGVAPFLIASSVIGVVAQRLVRKLCACHSVEPITPELSARLADAGLPITRGDIRVPGACGVCDRTGFKGRTAVAELLTVNESIRAMIRSGENIDAIREAARLRGMRLMHEDGLDKVKAGLTTYDEILRIVPFEAVTRCLCAACGQQLDADFQFCPFCGERRTNSQADTPNLEREGALLP